MLWVALHLNALTTGTLENLAAWACQFTPKVSLEPPQALLAEMQGSLRCFGGLEGFLAKLRAGLAELGCEASLAVEATPRAALWRARGNEEAFKNLPVSVTGFETEFLESIGISKIGELLQLPREGLAKRCGEGLLKELDQALGAIPEPRSFFAPPPRFAATLELPGEITHAEGLLFAANRLLLQLQGLLTARQAGIRSFTLTLVHLHASTAVEIRLASPARNAERLARLLRERLATVSLREPVEAIRLEAADFTPLHERSGAMFGDAAADEESWVQLAERLRVRLGSGAIHGLTTQPDHRPEHAWRCVEPGEWDPREFRQPRPRPARVPQAPRPPGPMGVAPPPRPEPREGGWLDGDEAKPDYFISRASDCSLVWIYRESGNWYLHGFFA